jgi:radical SAM superfamily enzyme YgiQ (UPF0313 family)
MKALLVYPEYPETFWSLRHALKFVSKKAAFPPLGLLTVASMLPSSWDLKLVDMNVDPLSEKDLQSVDYVLISAMDIQRESVLEVLELCRRNGTKTIAGGPLFTTSYGDFDDIDHLIIGEAEATLKTFLDDLGNGKANHMYSPEGFPDLSRTPIPAWDLIDMRKYSSMNVQYSRGCPFDCEFCDIVLLNGRVPRTKTTSQLLLEMDTLYEKGWRGGVFIVDDNFIGSKSKLKQDTLPAICRWMEDREYPFSLNTEVSIDLSDDEELMKLMAEANFSTVFVGIETTSEDSLAECGKFQNRNRDMLDSVKKIQKSGMQVQGGFIVGFDSDLPSVFEDLIGFIQESGIVTAMVGLLTAPTGTRLFKRLKSENRIVSDFSGNNTGSLTNFVPKMGFGNLVEGYHKILNSIYSDRSYYKRVKTFLKSYRPVLSRRVRPASENLKAFFRSIWVLGIKERGRSYYWKLLLWTLLRRPRLFPLSVELAIYGFHFRKALPDT